MKRATPSDKTLTLPYKFRPRPYQIPFWRAMDRGCRRAICVWHRRAGKDLTHLNFLISRMPKRRGAYYYYFPTSTQGRKILWDGVDRGGVPFLDHFPPGSILSKNDTEMKIKTVWGSLLQVVGTDRLEVVGPNPVGCVFSEFSLQSPRGWNYVRPILAENDGWAVFNGTPRGHNHHHKLFEMAKDNPDWFCQLLGADVTHAISEQAIDNERRAGMSEELIQQEFYCDWSYGLAGAYYGKLMAKCRSEGRVMDDLVYDPNHLVHTAWDIGYRDPTAIWWFQVVGPWVHVMDYYENSGEGVAHYISVLRDRREEYGFQYGEHFAPADILKHEMGTGKEIRESASDLGLDFFDLPVEKRVQEGIERTRRMLPHTRFHSRCEPGIECLEHYQKATIERLSTEYRPVYSNTPQHDWTSHGADSARYMSMALPFTEAPGDYYQTAGERPRSEMAG